MEIKLIALDLDGTTLNSKSRLTERTRKALEDAIAKGINVVVATGRTFTAVPEEVRSIQGMEYICTSNGAEIRNLRDQSLIYTNYITKESIEQVVEVLKDEEFMIEVFVDGKAYTDAVNYFKAVEGTLGFRNQEYIVNTRNPIEDIFAFTLENKERIENINVNFRDMRDKARMQPVLESIPNVTITSSFDHNWEIGGTTTSKADALMNLCSILEISPESILAGGDSLNDCAMLEFAGLPVAVENAKDEVKKIAKFIAPTNDEDGIAVAVEKFVLGK